jgi:hypothetical protein
VAQSSRKRRKQKRRAAAESGVAPAAKPDQREPAADRYARSRAKDEAARAALKPLAPGERPGAVTVAAVVAFGFGIANIVSYFAGVEVQGTRPAFAGILVYSGLMFAAAWGMWRARYWAVLGMQALLALIIIVFALLAVKFGDVWELLIAVAVVLAAGTLFWYLVKAMARIQMPERPGAHSSR